MINISLAKTLKIATIPYKHDMAINVSPQGQIYVSGIEGRFVEILMKNLGYSFEVVVPPDGEWGRRTADGNWTGIIGMVKNGEADLGVGFLAINEERSRVVDFSTSFDEQDKTFVTAFPKPLPKTAAFLYPFEWSVWLSCACILLLMSIVFTAISNKSLLHNVYICFGSLCNQGLSTGKEYSRFMPVYVSWHLFTLFVTLSYCAVLLSFLTHPLRQKGPKTIDDLAQAVNEGKYKFFILRGGADLNLLLNSKMQSIRNIGKFVEMNNWETGFGEKEYFGKLLEDRTAILAPRLLAYLRHGVPPFSTMYIAEEVFASTNVGIAMKNNFSCKKQLNSLIRRLSYGGIYRKLVADEIFDESHKRVYLGDSENHVASLSLSDVYGIFVCILVGYSLSFLALLGEITFFKFQFSLKKLNHQCFSFLRF